jgi:hypothetical protein
MWTLLALQICPISCVGVFLCRGLHWLLCELNQLLGKACISRLHKVAYINRLHQIACTNRLFAFIASINLLNAQSNLLASSITSTPTTMKWVCKQGMDFM